VDLTTWSLLQYGDHETLLNFVCDVEAKTDVKVPGVRGKLVHNIEPDKLKLDYELFATVERGTDETEMNQHVRLLRMIWNSSQ
jgi:hypothetical protein